MSPLSEASSQPASGDAEADADDEQTVGPLPPFDEELAGWLPRIHRHVPPTITPDMIGQIRADTAKTAAVSDAELLRDGSYRFEEAAANVGSDGRELRLLICRPQGVTGDVGALFFIHGGGMFAGNRRTGIVSALELAEPLGLAVVSVEYRLAPEHRYPAPLADCHDGLVWVMGQAGDFQIDPARVVGMGISAGGGLAAALGLLARDRGGPDLLGLLLASPMLDDRNETVSSLQGQGLGVWDRTSNATGWEALLGDRHGSGDVSPYASPARASDLSGLPPAFIDVVSSETFRDEGVKFAFRIWHAGGRAELHVWPGGFHGHDTMLPHTRLALATREVRGNWLRRLLS